MLRPLRLNIAANCFWTCYCDTRARTAKNALAVRETGVYRHNGGPLWTRLYDSAVIFRGVSRGVFIGHAWFQEMLISRTAIRLIAVVFPVWIQGFVILTTRGGRPWKLSTIARSSVRAFMELTTVAIIDPVIIKKNLREALTIWENNNSQRVSEETSVKTSTEVSLLNDIFDKSCNLARNDS